MPFTTAHGGGAVDSLVFTQNEKYMISSGSDGIGRLWDITSGNSILEYKGIRAPKVKGIF